ncbi:hypothetical protein A3D80_03800 [Candidatus Roizmanbacteria bacterium RIFCSPHIGHO2_02_FULL_40_13b]|uniref:Uncharacterized protein n=1 Tax=Candidatus Roizmanbacteria bacterium RIFCSPHIGHO2_01_FULL_39_24 TaxID=1802032 RepID=A0A1F7GG74_9BACT|nr:MAG: hypothetical protein A2799_03165 [Candidatus Roizmanbacteria bacterium RIFCSPHIGHO2_01_FULL_39_24]OGK27918.1 MAG: hypothetical protein A3D80_03800 [Candidatus Roizmanbacteria bacterium RIFCSPHIGHO2_02_FULL_40_13b]
MTGRSEMGQTTQTDEEFFLDPEGDFIRIGARANAFRRSSMRVQTVDSVYDEAMRKSITGDVANFVRLHGVEVLQKTSEDFSSRGGRKAELSTAVEPYIALAQERIRAAAEAGE